MFAPGGRWNVPRAEAEMVAVSVESGFQDTSKCLEVRGDGRRATIFCRMSAGEGAADRAEVEMALYRRDCVVCP